MIIPLMPFYAKNFGANGLVVGLLVSSFSIAQLLSAPIWGRFSDRYGRRPALIVGMMASAIAYVVFAYADSLWLLFLSRLVQGSGGGTVSVIQAYVADAVAPEQRAKGLGWLSAATNAGVAIGPVLGSQHAALGAACAGTDRRRALRAQQHLRIEVPDRIARHGGSAFECPCTRAVARRGGARDHALERAGAAADLDLRDRHRRVSGNERDSRALSGGAFRRDGGHDRLLLHLHRRHLGAHARAAPRAGGGSIRRSAVITNRSDAARDRAWSRCRSCIA